MQQCPVRAGVTLAVPQHRTLPGKPPQRFLIRVCLLGKSRMAGSSGAQGSAGGCRELPPSEETWLPTAAA